MKKLLYLFLLLSNCIVGQKNLMTDTLYHKNGNYEHLPVYNELDSITTIYEYYQNGNLHSVSLYKEGENYGCRTGFNLNGNIAYILNYINGNPHGPFTEFYEVSGMVKVSGMFYNNFKSGRWNYYNEFGKLDSIIEYTLSSKDSALINSKFEDEKDYIFSLMSDLKITYSKELVRLKLPDGTIIQESLPHIHIYKVLEPKKRRKIHVSKKCKDYYSN